MPLIILGLLVVAGLLAYMYFSSHPEIFVRKNKSSKKEDQEDGVSVIYLPNDIEREKRKRNVKTGKGKDPRNR